jgi:hypothetical protein
MPRLYNIKVMLVIPGTGYKHEGWLMADDEGTKHALPMEEALEFVKMTMERNEFQGVLLVPAVGPSTVA